ncbi:hypothetical protein BJ165DRAFT_1525493 [Panaeolus papilionaceus]|nr:hypothetical protein BJ165DRAFT_1525493 [Panaeolus papilionaceus]
MKITTAFTLCAILLSSVSAAPIPEEEVQAAAANTEMGLDTSHMPGYNSYGSYSHEPSYGYGGSGRGYGGSGYGYNNGYGYGNIEHPAGVNQAKSSTTTTTPSVGTTSATVVNTASGIPSAVAVIPSAAAAIPSSAAVVPSPAAVIPSLAAAIPSLAAAIPSLAAAVLPPKVAVVPTGIPASPSTIPTPPAKNFGSLAKVTATPVLPKAAGSPARLLGVAGSASALVGTHAGRIVARDGAKSNTVPAALED